MTASTTTTSAAEDFGRAASIDERPLHPRLSEAATHLTLPSGVVATEWPKIRYRLQTLGVELDPWQQDFSKIALGVRADGLWACGIDGVCASIPRQVGKTFLVSSLLIAMAIEYPGLKAVWTSHHARTTTNTFRSVQGAVKRPEIKPHLRRDRSNGIRTANGEQEIHFANGSMILFGARALGFGRGMDAVDVEVFDEAQILGLKALEDMVPAANAARNPHGGLLFFIGTPPRPVDDGAAFTAKRTAALAGDGRDGMWVEISGDEELDPYSPKQYLRANPSYPTRVGPAAMKRMQKNLPDLGAWQREALGIWPRDVIERVLPLWPERISTGPGEGVAPAAFGVDRAESGELSIAAGWDLGDARVHVEEVFSTRSLEAAAAFLDEVGRPRDPILIDEHSPARAVMPLLKARRMRGARTARVGDMIAACALTEAGIDEELLTHGGQESLARAIAAAMKRPIRTSAGGWVWAPRGDLPIHALNAASLAVLGASQMTTSSTSGGREAVSF